MKRQASNGVSGGLAIEQAPPGRSSHRVAPGQSLTIEVQRRPGGAVVRLVGSAGMTEAQPLRSRLEMLAAEMLPLIVLDLSELDFIGSAGLAAVLYARRKGLGRPGRIRLAAPQAAVLKVLQRARLTELLPIYPSVQRAMMG